MLYTSSLSNIENIYSKMYIILAVRYMPKSLKIDGPLKGHVAWYPTLSPNPKLLTKFKRDNDWDYYVEDFYRQYNSDPKMKELLFRIIGASLKNDICIMCYCTDFVKCHMKLLTDIGRTEFGADIKRIYKFNKSSGYTFLNEKGELIRE